MKVINADSVSVSFSRHLWLGVKAPSQFVLGRTGLAVSCFDQALHWPKQTAPARRQHELDLTPNLVRDGVRVRG
jgi:hypothetical protein